MPLTEFQDSTTGKPTQVGQATPLPVTMAPLSVSGGSGTKAQNNSFTTTNIKATPGRLLQVNIINTTASVRYFQVHDTTTTPGAGDTARAKYMIPANSQLTLSATDLGYDGLYCPTGIAIANSSVAATYTAGSAGDLLVDCVYV